MANFETWMKSDLKVPVSVIQLMGNLYSDDTAGNRIGVEVMNGGEPAELEGAVTGYFIRSDGKTVRITGELDGNRVSVLLSANCYAVPGRAKLVIKVGTTTVGACTTTVYRTATDNIIDET